MKIFIIKKGQFLNKETGETTNTINGRLKAINVETSEEGNRSLLFIFGNPENEETPAVKVKLYGDASLKILRCLYGIFDEIGGKDVAITLTPQEGTPAQISLTADGEALPPLCHIGDYGIERRNLTDLILCRLAYNLRRVNVPLVVVHIDEKLDLTDETRPLSEVVADFIRTARAEGRSDRYAIAKHCFANGVMKDGYLTAVREGAVLGRTFWFDGPEDIDRVWLAHVEPLDVPTAAPAEGSGDEEV